MLTTTVPAMTRKGLPGLQSAKICTENKITPKIILQRLVFAQGSQGSQGNLGLERRRVGAAGAPLDFLTVETPVARPPAGRHHARSFHLKRCADFWGNFCCRPGWNTACLVGLALGRKQVQGLTSTSRCPTAPFYLR